MPLIDTLTIGTEKFKPAPEVRAQMVSAVLEMTTSQVSQLTITFADPSFTLMNTSFGVNTPIDLTGLQLVVATLDVKTVGGVAGFSIDCRPRAVRFLKDRQGARVMANSSATDFVLSECAAVGAHVVAQPSAKRKSVSRDVPQPGSQETENPPSSWTTFGRLANEEGFILFESMGTIYFGQPTWIRGRSTINVFMDYNLPVFSFWQALEVPSCHWSIDSTAVTVSGRLPADRQPYIKCGNSFIVQGIPKFDKFQYMITSVSLNCMNDTEPISVEASSPINPKPQPPAA